MRTAIYVRISEDDGTALGVKRQESDGRAEAERRGWDVIDVYADNDVSATRGKTRPSYERMMRDARSGLIQAILVWDIDRLTRTPREIEDVIELADRTGLVLVNLTGAGDLGTDDGRMMLRIKGALARREVEQMRKRLKRKYQEKAENGEPHGRAPYGMMRVEGRDVPDPETAPILRELARRVLDGESLRGVARDLTERGVPGPGSPSWNSTIIRQALLRPSYAGLRQYQGAIIGKTNGEPVFDEDTHARLIALLRDPSRKQNHRGREPIYLLSGLARCGRCGGPMRSLVGRIAQTKTGEKRQPPAYGCSVCFKVRRLRESVDALVEQVVIERLNDPEVIGGLFSAGDPGSAREAMESIATIDARLAVAADQFADGAITGDQLKRITAKLRGDRELADARLRAAAPNDRLAAFTRGDVAEVWAESSMLARREVVDTLVTVTIEPQGSGRGFDPDAIRVEWKAG